MDFWTRFNEIEADAAASEDGKTFIAGGFRIHANGGNLTAWRKDIDSNRHILVTDSDGSSHELSADGHAFVEGADDEYMIGVYSEDGNEDGGRETASTAESAIAHAASLAAPSPRAV